MPTSYVQNELRYIDYKNCLFEENKKEKLAEFWKIGSKDHEIKFQLQKKRTLSLFDDKRYLLVIYHFNNILKV